MSLESLEEMLKKQFPNGAPVEVPYRNEAPVGQVLAVGDARRGTPAQPASQATVEAAVTPQGTPQFKVTDKSAIDVVGYETDDRPRKTYAEEQQEKIAAQMQAAQPIIQAAPQSREFDDIRQQITEFRNEGKEAGGLHWAELLGMAIPVAVGASVGQLGAPAKSSGAYGISRAAEERKRADSINTKITELQRSLATAQGRMGQKNPADPNVTALGPDGKPYDVPRSVAMKLGWPTYKEDAFQKIEYLDEEGKPRIGAFSTKKGESRTTQFDPLAPADAKTSGESGKDQRQLAAQRFQAIAKVTAPNSPITLSMQNIDGIAKAQELLNSGGPIAESILPSLIARSVAGEKGVLTEQDVARVQGDPALLSKYNRLWGKFLAGESLGNADRQDVAVLLKIAYQVESDKLKRVSKGFGDAFSSVGVDVNEGINAFIGANQPKLKPLTPRKQSASIENRKDLEQGIITGPVRMPDGTVQIRKYRMKANQ